MTSKQSREERQRDRGSAYLNISKMLVIGSPWSSHLTCCWRSPIITSPIWVTRLLGGHKDPDFIFFRYEKHVKHNYLLGEKYVSLLMAYQMNALEFGDALVSRVDIKCSIVNTEYYADCQVHPECSMNVIKKGEKLLRAWYDNSWEAVLVLPHGSEFAFP